MNFFAGFSKSKKPGFISKMQMKFFKIDYSHCYIRFNIRNQNVVWQSTGRFGTHLTSWEQFQEDRIPKHEFLIETPYTPEQILKYCLDTRKTYGTFQMLGAGIAWLFRLKQNPFVDDEEEHCSMAQIRFLMHFMPRTITPVLTVPKKLPLWTPRDCFEYCTKMKFRKNL